MKKLYVGGLPYSTTDEELREHFAKYGEIQDEEDGRSGAVVVKDRETGRSRGFGFVTFVNDEDADKAVAELNETEFGGRTIIVNEARPREERPRGDMGYRR